MNAVDEIVTAIWNAEQHEPTLTGLLALVLQKSPATAKAIVKSAGLPVPTGAVPSEIPVRQQLRISMNPSKRTPESKANNRRPDIVFALGRKIYIIEAKAGNGSSAKKQARSYVRPLEQALTNGRTRVALNLQAV